MTASIYFDYTFRFEEDPENPLQFRIELDPITLTHALRDFGPLPDWTLRGDTLCEHCEARGNETHCPLAVSIAEVTNAFEGRFSFTRVALEVNTPSRTYTADTTLQRALGSLLGLYMATSQCPIMAPFKPMARYHLPLATREETVFRAVGAYLIGQFLRAQQGHAADITLDGLQDAYAKVHAVNKVLADRLRVHDSGDANINAIVVLDLLAHELPYSIKTGLDEMLPMYAHLFDDRHAPHP